MPTIITGIFVYGLIVVPQGQQSGFAASVALAIVMLPIVARTAQEVLAPGSRHAEGGRLRARHRPLAHDRADHAADRGRRPDHRRPARGRAGGRGDGAADPALLDLRARACSPNPSEALASIPIFIFQSSESPSPEAHTQAWAAALVLIAFVLVLNIVARAFYARSRKRMGA